VTALTQSSDDDQIVCVSKVAIADVVFLADLSGGYDLGLDRIFERGLQPMLDGLAGLFERRRR